MLIVPPRFWGPRMATIEKRICKNGDVAYRVKIRLRGHPPVNETFSRREDAKRWIQKTETEIRDGLYFPKQEAKKHTVAEAIDCYLDHLRFDNPGRYRDVSIILKWWRNELGDCMLSDISKGLIMQKRTLLTKENIKRGEKIGVRSASTINRYMSAMSTMFKYISKQYDWMLDNPMRDIKSLREPEGIVRYLSEDERHRLLQACNVL